MPGFPQQTKSSNLHHHFARKYRINLHLNHGPFLRDHHTSCRRVKSHWFTLHLHNTARVGKCNPYRCDTAFTFNVCTIFPYKIMPLYLQVYTSWCTTSCNDTVRNADYMASGNWERVMNFEGCGIVVNLTVLFGNLSEWDANLGIVGVSAETETSRIKVRKVTTWTKRTDMVIV